METASSVKILFRFYSNILDEDTVETMWAEVVNLQEGLYKIANIPFFVPLLASGDIVFAEHDDTEQMLTYRKTVDYSGNSTIHVVMMGDKMEINDLRKIFEDMGAETERLNKGYFALEIPAYLDYFPVRKKLVNMKNDNIIDFAETCLSDRHAY